MAKVVVVFHYDNQFSTISNIGFSIPTALHLTFLYSDDTPDQNENLEEELLRINQGLILKMIFMLFEIIFKLYYILYNTYNTKSFEILVRFLP